jgi:Ran GTPase-activating protein (RanGAP) involved in mRNA processing and transport
MTVLSLNIDSQGVGQLAQALPHTTSMLNLDVGNSSLGRATAAMLNPILGHYLQALNLSQNSIGELGCADLALALGPMVELKKLDLTQNELGPAGLQVLIPTLQTLSNLHHLSLGRNNLKNQGATVLGNALTTLPRLWQLDLENNHIGRQGAIDLEALITCEVLGVPRNTPLQGQRSYNAR